MQCVEVCPDKVLEFFQNASKMGHHSMKAVVCHGNCGIPRIMNVFIRFRKSLTVFPDPQLGARMCISRPCRTRTHAPETNLAALEKGADCQGCYPVARKIGMPPLFGYFQDGRRISGGRTQLLRINCPGPQKVRSFRVGKGHLEYQHVFGI